MIIYCHTNTMNGKRYVGQTKTSLELRWKGHCKTARRKGRKLLFHCAISSTNEDVWLHEVLEQIDTQDLANQREKYWISYFRSNEADFGYNCTSGGDKIVFTLETLKKISKASKNRRHTPESRKAISIACKATWAKKIEEGYHLSDEQRHKLSVAQTGKKRPMKQSTREKIGNAHRGVKEVHTISEETRQRLSQAQRNRRTYEARTGTGKHIQKLSDKELLRVYEDYKTGQPLDELSIRYEISSTQLMRRLRLLLGKTPEEGWNWSLVSKRYKRCASRKKKSRTISACGPNECPLPPRET